MIVIIQNLWFELSIDLTYESSVHECQKYLPRCSDSIIRTQYFPLRYGNDPSLLNTFLFNETSLLNRRHYLTLSSSTRRHSRRRVMTRHYPTLDESSRTLNPTHSCGPNNHLCLRPKLLHIYLFLFLTFLTLPFIGHRRWTISSPRFIYPISLCVC